jgi:hypothetical protein
MTMTVKTGVKVPMNRTMGMSADFYRMTLGSGGLASFCPYTSPPVRSRRDSQKPSTPLERLI